MTETKTVEQLQEEAAAAKKEAAAAKKDFEEAMKLNEELQNKLEASSASGSKKPVVKIDKVSYEVAYPSALVPVEGKLEKKTAEQIAANKELCKKLIESGSKILKLVK